MNRQKPEVIIFDLGRVLVDYDFSRAVRKLARYSPLSASKIHDFFRQTPAWDAFERGRITPREFFKILVRDLQLNGLTFSRFKPLWNEIFRAKRDSVAILRRLRGRYRLAMLSNVNELHWKHIRQKHAFMKWFDTPVASYAVGYRKPDAEIYRLTLKKAKVSPACAIFIDDIPAHVTAARALGIRAHQFISAKRLIKDLDGILE
jgi:glucose-1-phosphatase